MNKIEKKKKKKKKNIQKYLWVLTIAEALEAK